MFSNWKGKVATVGGFIGFVLTVLPFFDIYARDVAKVMTAHYVWGIGALVSLAVFVWGIIHWRNTSRVTIGNVQSKLRSWLDAFGLSHRVYEFAGWHFTFDVRFNDVSMFVGRPRRWGGRYISVLARVSAVDAQQMAILDNLSPELRAQFYRELVLEMSRARIAYNWTPDIRNISVSRYLPITGTLSESDVIAAIEDVSLSTVLIWTTAALLLSANPITEQQLITDAPLLASGPTGPSAPIVPVIDSDKKGKTGPKTK